MKILDCTLRDGGYYNDWDFDSRTVDCYLAAMNRLPVDMIEVGYRSLPSKSYMGRFGYSPRFELERVRERSQKQVAVMFNEKDIRVSDLPTVLDPVADLVDMVRMAVAPTNMARAIELGRAIKERGIAVAFNVMYMSKWSEMAEFLELLPQLDGWVDCINMVDSFGGVTPNDVRRTFAMVRERTSVPIGFHGHNNLELALINTLAAIDCGAEWVDATVLGLGRGAGNLKLELLLTFLSKRGLEVDFNVLGEVVSHFSTLHAKYGWGTSLPYMLSGANSLPQKEVMAWVSNRLLSLNSIVRALENKRLGVEDNDKFPEWQAECAERVLVVGGGERVAEHIDAVRAMLEADPQIVVVHASSRHAALFEGLANPQIFCLVGDEGHRMERVFDGLGDFSGRCILPPYPRKMGTDVPASVADKTFELHEVTFTDLFRDSCTAMALQAAIEMQARSVMVVGYDGYTDMVLTQRERDLTAENEYIMEAFDRAFEGEFVSLTPTLYNALKVDSIYHRI